jgi:5-methylcytosine-specific restriction endonuclease McrA
MLKDPNKDNLKTELMITRQHEKICKIPNCEGTITIFEGPGSEVLCRDHQLQCKEYGGFGNPAEPHTFFRDWICSNPLCNYDPRKDPAFDELEEPLKSTAMKYQMHGDHIVPRALGGTDAKENIQVLCKKCHDIKSFKNGDFANKTKKVINDR